MIGQGFGGMTAPLWAPGFVTQPGNSNTAALSVGTLRVSPIYVPNRCRLIAILGEVTVVGDAGALLRLGLWESDPTTGAFPARLVTPATSTAIAADAVAIGSAAINVVVGPGVYWAGAVAENTVTVPTIRSCTGAGTAFVGSTAAVGVTGLSFPGQTAGTLGNLTPAAVGYTATTPKISFQVGVL